VARDAVRGPGESRWGGRPLTRGGESTTHSLVSTASFEPVAFEIWRARVEETLSPGEPRGAIERLVSRTFEGIPIAPLYSGPPVADAGEPGAAPFVRASTADQAPIGCPRYRFPDLAFARTALPADQRGGAEGAWLVLPELPARSVTSLRRLLEGVAPTPILLDAGPDALPALALMAEHGAPPSLWLGADPLGALAVAGILPGSLDAFEAELAETVKRVADLGDGHRAVVVSTLPHHEAGAHVVLELGYALATIAGYLRGVERHGVDAATLARRLTLRVAIGGDVFLEIAKLRALRGLVHHLLAACGVADVSPPIHAVTSPRSLSQRDPWVNMLRATTQVFAAIIGEAEVITVLPFDEALGVPSELGQRLARNTLMVLREESLLGAVDDPIGGSWYVETLSDELARLGWNLLQRIEAAGGMARHITSGTLRREVDEAQRVRRLAIARRKLPLVGVSEFAALDQKPVTRSRWTLATLDESPVGRRLASFDDLAAAAREGANLSALGRALERGPRTLAEALPTHRDAEEIERLRAAAEAMASRPSVLLACLGPASEHRPRVGFARAFFAAAGIETVESEGTGDDPPDLAAAKLAAALITRGSRAACLCGSDARYASHALAVAKKLKEAGASYLTHAGRPADREQALRAAGVDAFLFVGCDLPAVAAPLLRALGARLPKLAEEEHR
jgi:methylmalonyl-CoA mutase